MLSARSTHPNCTACSPAVNIQKPNFRLEMLGQNSSLCHCYWSWSSSCLSGSKHVLHLVLILTIYSHIRFPTDTLLSEMSAWSLQAAKKGDEKSCKPREPPFIKSECRASDGDDIIPSWACHVMGTVSLTLSLYCFPRTLTISQCQWSRDYTGFVTFANKTAHNVIPCDVHHSVVVLWRGCQSQRSTCCWGIWLQYETTSPVWQLRPSEQSSCTAPDPTSNSNGYWAETHMFRTAMLFSQNLQCIVYIPLTILPSLLSEYNTHLQVWQRNAVNTSNIESVSFSAHPASWSCRKDIKWLISWRWRSKEPRR